MKKKLIILVLLLVGFSLNAFSYDINKPIWEQVDFITCTQTKHTDCIDHSCKVSEKPILKFTVDFINNEIVFLPNRSMSVIDKLHEFNDNKLLTIRAGENVIRILPPLIVKKKEVDLAIKIIRKVCKEYKT